MNTTPAPISNHPRSDKDLEIDAFAYTYIQELAREFLAQTSFIDLPLPYVLYPTFQPMDLPDRKRTVMRLADNTGVSTKDPAMSHYFSPRMIKLGCKYSSTVMSREMQITETQLHTILWGPGLPSVENYLRLLAISAVYLPHILAQNKFNRPHDDYVHIRGGGCRQTDYHPAIPTVITLTTVMDNIRDSIKIYRSEDGKITKLAKSSGLTKPTLYKMMNHLDTTVSMRSLIKLCMALEDSHYMPYKEIVAMLFTHRTQ